MTEASKRPVFPMPRAAFLLLMICVVMSVLPHIERLPRWMLLLLPVVMLWRFLVFRERIRFPSRWLRLLMVATGCVGVGWHYGTIFGPDAGVALLVTAYLFKLLEMYTRRDAFLVVILSYFVLATEFLFSTSFYSALYILVVLVFITAALIALNQSERQISVRKPLRLALVAVLQAIPLMLVLFYLFPRIAPLWDLGMKGKNNTRGLTESVSPGDIAELSLSSELAFRLDFKDTIPLPRDRYWRAMIFDRFDGRTWHAQTASKDLFHPDQIEYRGQPLQYRVYLEPTGQRWLPAAAWAQLDGVKNQNQDDLTFSAAAPVNSAISYGVTSYLDYQYQASGINRPMWSRYTSLPADGNPQTVAAARKLYRQAKGDPKAMSDLILDWFYKEQFVYTLHPPRLGNNSIDDFLFNTHKGFCAHYAGAFTFMMRAAGIPTRMVVGYQGGEKHPLGNYLLVRQYDAHAWTEFWLQGEGWVRVDPTSAIAPDRIESGSLRESLDEQSLLDSPFSALNLGRLPIFGQLRLLGDYIDYLWFRNVVSYDGSAQGALFKTLLGKVTPQRLALLLAGSFLLVALLLTVWIVLSRRSLTVLSRADRDYLRFLRSLASRGIERQQGEGVLAFCGRAGQLLPEQAHSIEQISRLYSDIKYGNPAAVASEMSPSGAKSDRISPLEQQLRQAVASFKP